MLLKIYYEMHSYQYSYFIYSFYFLGTKYMLIIHVDIN